MDRADWKTVEERLVYPGATIRLRADGREVTLQVHREGIRMQIGVYVDGWMRGEWIFNDCEERRRFMRPKVRKPKPYTRSQIRALGKNWCEEQIKRHTVTYWLPYWPSVRLLRRHFEANNESIELINEEASST